MTEELQKHEDGSLIYHVGLDALRQREVFVALGAMVVVMPDGSKCITYLQNGNYPEGSERIKSFRELGLNVEGLINSDSITDADKRTWSIWKSAADSLPDPKDGLLSQSQGFHFLGINNGAEVVWEMCLPNGATLGFRFPRASITE